MGGNGGPPNKWVKFSTEDLDSNAVLDKLNELAAQGFTSAAVAVECTDGDYVFVGGYGSGNQA